MAGIRGVRNPVPSKGGAESGIFSSKGSQKKDALSPTQRKHAGMAGNNFDKPRKGPTKRDNGLK